MKSYAYPTLLLALAAAAPAFAENKPAGDIFVTATRLPEIGEAQTSAISTLTAEDLERRQIVFVGDALATLPGVTMSQNGALGGQASIRIRGAASQQTLFLVDGVPVNDASAPGGGYDVSTLDAADIEKIEVLRGPHSTLWGSDAIGGVVAVTTRRAGKGITGNAFAEGGSFGTLRTGGGIAYGGERVDARISANAITTDGISRAAVGTEDDPYNAGTVNGRVGIDVTEALRVEAFGRYTRSKTDYDGYGPPFFAFGDTDNYSRTHDTQGGVLARYNMFGGKLENVVIASRDDIDREAFSNSIQSSRAGATRDTLRYQGTWRVSDLASFAFGAEREETEIKVESPGPFGSINEGSSQIDSLFALGEWAPIESLTLTAGVRYDDHDQFGDVTTSRLGASWQPVDALGVRGSWGQGFKAPTIYQLTAFFFPATAPNTALKPEEADGWDAAVFTDLLDGKLHAELGYFSIDTKNMIDFDPFANTYGNIAKAKSEGVEFSLSYAINDALTLAGNYTYTDATNEVTGAKLIRIPENAAYAEIDWKVTKKLNLTLTGRYNSSEDDVDPDTFLGTTNKSWSTFDLAARYAVSDKLEVYGRVENLTDEDYQDVAGYGEPGTAVYGGVRVRFE